MDPKFFRKLSDMLTESTHPSQLDTDELEQMLVQAGYTDTKLELAELVDKVERYVYQIEYYNSNTDEMETGQVGVEVDMNGQISVDFIQ